MRSAVGRRPLPERRRLVAVSTVGLILMAVTVAVSFSRDPGGRSSDVGGTGGVAAVPLGPGVDGSAVSSTTAPQPSCDVAAAVAAWPVRTRLAQVLFVGVNPGDPASAQRAAEAQVGGIFIGGNRTDIFTAGVLPGLQSVKVPPFVAVDDEGGRVQRIDALVGSIVSARTMARTMTPVRVRALARQRGTELLRLGVTMDFAPVADVSSQPDKAVIGDRSFSDDARTVARYAAAFADGLRDAGVQPVLKHFPGHGRASGDSHLGPASTPSLAEIEAVDLVPYRSLLKIPGVAVIVGALDVPGLTDGGPPASLNPATIDGLLRGRFKFSGLVVTDDLGGMRAVASRYDTPEAVSLAIGAGADLALVGGRPDVARLLDQLEFTVAAKRMDVDRLDAAVVRVLAAKGADPC